MSADRPLKILFELRPALEGHAGIPQETRLLFRCLSSMPDVQMAGLLQSSGRLLPAGVPPAAPNGATRLSADERVERMGRIVITFDAPFSWSGAINTALQTIRMAFQWNLNGNEILTLVTCYPFYFVGAAPSRFIVRAARVISAS